MSTTADAPVGRPAGGSGSQEIRHKRKPRSDMLLGVLAWVVGLVFVSPVYWYSIPSQLKTYIDHWSGWMRTPGVPFKDSMAQKRLHLITTSGDRAKAQPMIDSVRLCAEFLSMGWGGVLWGKGGPPGAVQADDEAVAVASGFLMRR